MRPTLHEYLHEQFNKPLKMSETWLMRFRKVYDYGELTSRKPKIEDFIGENAIFKGEWEVVDTFSNGGLTISNDSFVLDFFPDGRIICWTKINDSVSNQSVITRIEDLPREIEFKENAI